MSDLKAFAMECRDWLETNCPAEMRKPVESEKDICWGGRNWTYSSKAQEQWLERMADSGCNMLGLDWTISIADAKARVGNRVALQGNMDPALLETTPERASEEARQILDEFDGNSGHVFNLGHGIRPTANPEIVAALVETVHNHRKS